MLSGMRGQKGEWKWEELGMKEDVGRYSRKKIMLSNIVCTWSWKCPSYSRNGERIKVNKIC